MAISEPDIGDCVCVGRGKEGPVFFFFFLREREIPFPEHASDKVRISDIDREP